MLPANSDYKIISVTPAGRERYLRILVPYLLRNRHILSEHHFWLNTNRQTDIAYIEGLAEKFPDFFKINRKELFSNYAHFASIWQYFQDYTDESTVYIRFDDDICFIAPDAIPALIKHRLANPRPFLVYGNIINNAVCTHIQQLTGTVPSNWGKVSYSCLDRNGWKNPGFSARLHKHFLADLEQERMNRWKFGKWVIEDYRRFSVNVISWFGKDMKMVDELNCGNLVTSAITDPLTGNQVKGEEQFISETLPRRFSRPCEICGEAIFSHFAFYTQRSYLEKATALLERYHALALNNDSRLPNAGFKNSELMKKTRYGISLILNIFPISGFRSWNRKLNLNARYKTFIMIKYPGFYSALRKIKRTLLFSGTGLKTPPDRENQS